MEAFAPCAHTVPADMQSIRVAAALAANNLKNRFCIVNFSVNIECLCEKSLPSRMAPKPKNSP
jgi:hypothetical protein